MSRLLLLAAILSSAVNAATFTVDTTDNGNLSACTAAPADCSYNGAVTRANNAGGADAIAFDIPLSEPGCSAATGVCRIQFASGPVTVLGPLIVDGYTQPGASANTLSPDQGGSNAQLKIELRGCPMLCGFGILCSAPVTLRGLAIGGFSGAAGVWLDGNTANGSVIEGNFIGTDASGSVAVPNINGINASGNPAAGAQPQNLRIGGALPAQRNLISGNIADGINSNSTGLQIFGNLIGTDATGMVALPNQQNGVFIAGCGNGSGDNARIGGLSASERNVIAGNGSHGVQIGLPNGGCANTVGALIRGNYLGAAADGVGIIGNGLLDPFFRPNVLLRTGGGAGAPNIVGGREAGAGNLIAGAVGAGVELPGDAFAAAFGNRSRDNRRLGIDSGPSNTRNLNDANDADNNFGGGSTGRNQNFPVISAYSVSGGSAHISYSIDSAPANSVYPLRVDFYQAAGDEGGEYLGSDTYTAAEAQTVKAVILTIPPGLNLSADDVIVATATDADSNNSEFSFHLASLSVAPASGSASLPLTFTATVTALSGPFKPNGRVGFSIDSSPVQTCSGFLVPTVTANVSRASCTLTPTAAGNFTVTSVLVTNESAFGSATGGDLTATAAAQVGNAPLVVDTTADASLTACTAAPGDCSLRGAITTANAGSATDTIVFSIPSSDPGCVAATGVCQIAPLTGLPSITNGELNLDGYTQPGAVPNSNTPAQGGSNAQLKIVLSGASCPGCSSGINYFTTGGTVRGLVINGFSGAALDFSGRNTVVGIVEGCFIGTDVSGTIAVPNGLGVVTGGNPFGGDFSSNARVGGSLPAQRNVISGQTGDGINGGGANFRILGNLIGTNAAGTAALGNGTGVRLSGGVGFFQILGGADIASRNLISGNGRGVVIGGAGPTNGTRVIGNFIGTDVSGTLPLGNSILGIELSAGVNGAQPPLVGGTLAGEGNLIAFNGTQGVATRNTRGQVVGNRMFRNGQLGISGRTGDNGSAAGRLPNDPGDPDNPANNGQNFPEISAFAVSGGNVDLSYRVDSTVASSAYPLRIEFYRADGDEGRDFIGADSYLAAQAQSIKPISLPIPPGLTLSNDDVIVATATDANGNTSEFSFALIQALSILSDGPDPSPAGSPYSVSVRAESSATPFRPNGQVLISDGRGASCLASLLPTATANRSEGTCELVTTGAAGGVTLSASYSTFANAFATASGDSIADATTSHQITAGVVALDAEGGNNQYARVGGAFSEALRVRVLGDGGAPFAGATVQFSAPVSGASASLSALSAVSDANGFAEVVATANGVVGRYAVTARIGALTQLFILNNDSALGSRCTGARSSTLGFRDDFAGAAIDPARWNVDANDGSVTVGAGEATVNAGNVVGFPYVSANASPLPTSGAFALRWVATYTSTSAVYGNNSMVATTGLPPDGGPVGSTIFHAFAGQYPSGYVADARISTTDGGPAAFISNPPALVRREVEFCWLDGRDELWVDGVRVENPVRDPTLLRPDALWFGNFDRGVLPGEHPDFRLDLVEVRSLEVGFDTDLQIVAHTPNPSAAGQAVTVSVAVNPEAGAPAAPTGAVLVQGSTGESCNIALPASSCALSFATIGERVIEATYSGDPVFRASKSARVDHTVLPPATLSISDVTLAEGNSDSTAFVFTVSLSNATGAPVTVDYASANGSASAPGDYASVGGQLSFSGTTTSLPITVNVVGDSVLEADEQFVVNLSNPVGATLADAQGSGNINNDDAPTPLPSLRVLDAGLVTEPAGSVLFRTISFALELDRAPTEAVSVTVETRDGSALAGQDYVRQEGLVVEFAPGEMRASASVRIARDSFAEAAENFFLDADTPVGLTIADATGEAIIVASGTPLVVNSTADTDDGLCSPSAGGCTLREAILNANGSTAISEIAFAIPGTQTQVIRPLTPLPPLSRLLSINGYSQPGAVENTVSAGSGNALNSVIKVEIDGGLLSTGNGIKLCAGGTVRGLAIHSFADAAIAADCGVSNQPVALFGNYLGVKSDGLTPAGNGFGVRAEPTDDGRAQTQFTIGELNIGYTNAAARNLIAANRVAAIAVAPRQRFVTTSIEGNLIGTDRSGNVPLANAAGIVFTQPHPRCITLLQVRDNVIAASSGDGLRMNVANPPLLPDSCVVQTPEPLTILHNRIGVGLDENAWMPNGGTAIRIDGVIARPPGFASGGDGNTLIGGRFADTQNLLLHQNGAAIVIVGAATRIPISGNRSLNANQLVDLGGDGPTPNDPGDGDSGPNTLLNAPIPGLAVVDLAARVVRVSYTLDASFSGGDEPRVYLYRVGETQELVAVDNSVVAGNNLIDLSLNSTMDAGDQLALSLVSPTLGSSELSPPFNVVGVTPALVADSRLENATPLRATLSLSPAPSVPIAFAVSTRDGSAVAGSDYVALNSTVTLTPAQPSANIDVTLLNDSAIENPETLIIDVVPANRGLGVAGVSAEAVIDDDDVRSLDQSLYDTLHLSDLNGRNGVRLQISGALANSDVRIVGSGDFVNGPEPDLVVSAARTWPSTASGATATSLYVIPGAATPLPALLALDSSSRSTRISGFDRTLMLAMGQVSGDARQELLAGEAYALAGAGRVTLVPGGLPVASLTAAIASLPGSRIVGTTNNAEERQFGESVSFIGDLNGDGIGDFAATAPESGGSSQTSVNIIYGRVGSFPASLTIASNLAQGGARLVGDAQLSLNRMHVRGIGDFNGDGRNDLAIIGYGGCAVIVPGQAGGYTGRIPISGIAGLIRVCAPFMNEARTSHDRRPLAGGDINGDGRADLVFGQAARADSRSRAYIVYGRSSPPAVINVPGALSSEILGEWAEDGFSSIDVLPDFDGDGRSDVAFGSRGSDQNGASAGTVFVLYGAANLPPSIDLNASTPVLGKRIEGVAGSRTGFEVRALADINGDGLGDLGITAADAGRNAYVIYSSERILGSAFEAQPPARIGPTRFDLGRSPGTPWTNEPALRPTRTVGDLNNDGRVDLVADGYCLNGDCTERVSMVALGSAALSVNTQQLTGRTGFVVLNAQRTSAAGNFNGDGFGDLLVQGSNRAMVLYGKLVQGRAVFPATVSLGVAGGPPRTSGTTELRFAASTAILREVRGIGDFGGGPESDLLVTWCPFGCTFGSERRARVVFGTPDRPSTLAVDNLSAGRFVDLTTANGVSLSMASSMPLGDFGGDSKSDLALFINNDGVADPRTALVFGGASLPASIDPLTTAQGFRTTGPSPSISAVGRFTSGTKDDIAFDYNTGSVQIYRGRSGAPGDNLFPLVNSALFGPQFTNCTASTELPPPSGLVSSADLNGDGQLELLMRSRGEGRARSAGAAPWLRGRGVAWENRAYSVCNQTDPPALLVTGESQAAQLVPIGDWDGDGKQDFVDLVRGLIYRGAEIPALP